MTPTREQVVQWANAVGMDLLLMDGRQISRQESFAILARADLEATIADLSARLDLATHERNNLLETCAGQDKIIAEQAREIERMKVEVDQIAQFDKIIGVFELRQQLVASQVENVKLREAIVAVDECVKLYSHPGSKLIGQALALPHDDTALHEALTKEREECAKIADLFEEKADALNDSIADDEDPNEGRSEYIMGKASASSRIAAAIRARADKEKP